MRELNSSPPYDAQYTTLIGGSFFASSITSWCGRSSKSRCCIVLREKGPLQLRQIWLHFEKTVLLFQHLMRKCVIWVGIVVHRSHRKLWLNADNDHACVTLTWPWQSATGQNLIIRLRTSHQTAVRTNADLWAERAVWIVWGACIWLEQTTPRTTGQQACCTSSVSLS